MKNGQIFKTTLKDGLIETWYNDVGELHREDGPAVIYHDLKLSIWYQNGVFHRNDGPVIVNEQEEIKGAWYLNGKRYSFKKWVKKTDCPDEKKVELRLRES